MLVSANRLSCSAAGVRRGYQQGPGMDGDEPEWCVWGGGCLGSGGTPGVGRGVGIRGEDGFESLDRRVWVGGGGG
jgi:hypothetical protein